MKNELYGSARQKVNGEWWFCVSGALKGPAIKGYGRKIIYKLKLANPERVSFNGQSVKVKVENKQAVVI